MYYYLLDAVVDRIYRVKQGFLHYNNVLKKIKYYAIILIKYDNKYRLTCFDKKGIKEMSSKALVKEIQKHNTITDSTDKTCLKYLAKWPRKCL